MTDRVFTFVRAVVFVLLAGLCCEQAKAGTVDDFAATNTNNAVRARLGSAGVQITGPSTPGNDNVNDTSFLRLTPSSAGQSGFVTYPVSVTGNSTKVVVDVDVRCMNGSDPPADGMGIVLLNTTNSGTTGAVQWNEAESPSIPGALGIGLNIFNGFNGGTNLKVFFNNAQVGGDIELANAPYNYNFYKGASLPNTTAFDHITLTADFAAARISLSITPAGQQPIQVLNNFAVPGLTPYRWRLGFGGRSGSFFAIYDLDNIDARGLSVPTLTGPGLISLQEDATRALGIAASDPDGGTLTYAVTGPSHGTLIGTAPNWTYVPETNYSGPDSVTVTVTDPEGNSPQPLTIPITVVAVNEGGPLLMDDEVTLTANGPVVLSVLANDTVNDLPAVVTIQTPPQFGTVVVNADKTVTYTPVAGYSGADSFEYRVTDAEGESASAMVRTTIPASAPAIQSVLSITLVESLPISYAIDTVGSLPITYTAAPLPAGISLDGNKLVGSTVPGSYLVSLVARNGVGFDFKQLVINVIELNPASDTDLDGFSDELEIGVGSSPVDAASTPFTFLKNADGGMPAMPPGGYSAKPQPFSLGRSGMAVKLNFVSLSPYKDSLALTGTLPVPPGFFPSFQPVAVMVGGKVFNGLLDSKGTFTSADKAVKIKVSKSRSVLSSGNVGFSVKVKGSFSDALADEGLVNADIKNSVVPIGTSVIVGGHYYGARVEASYSAKAGKSGSAKGGAQ